MPTQPSPLFASPDAKETFRQNIVKQVGLTHKKFVQNLRDGLYDAQTSPSGGISSPYTWWNIWALGPFLAPLPYDQMDFLPLQSVPDGQVLPAGTTAYVATILYLNPAPILSPNPGLSPGSILSNFSVPYQITYNTANLSTWQLANLTVDGHEARNPMHLGNLRPKQFFYVDILEFSSLDEGLMEMNITARLLGDVDQYKNAPQFAAFATWSYGFNEEQLKNAFIQGDHSSNPLKFLVYSTT